MWIACRQRINNVLGLCFCLHKDELPLASERFLEPRQVLRLIIGQLQPLFVLHRSFAQVYGCKKRQMATPNLTKLQRFIFHVDIVT